MFGILCADDRFYIKVMRKTIGSALVPAPLPTGADVLLIGFEDVELESHLKQLSPLETREYVRVRLRQLKSEYCEAIVGYQRDVVYEAKKCVEDLPKPHVDPEDANWSLVVAISHASEIHDTHHASADNAEQAHHEASVPEVEYDGDSDMDEIDDSDDNDHDDSDMDRSEDSDEDDDRDEDRGRYHEPLPPASDADGSSDSGTDPSYFWPDHQFGH